MSKLRKLIYRDPVTNNRLAIEPDSDVQFSVAAEYIKLEYAESEVYIPWHMIQWCECTSD